MIELPYSLPTIEEYHDISRLSDFGRSSNKTTQQLTLLSTEELATLTEELRVRGISKFFICGTGNTSIALHIGNNLILYISHFLDNIRAVDELVIQPLNQPFRINNFRFEVLPYVASHRTIAAKELRSNTQYTEQNLKNLRMNFLHQVEIERIVSDTKTSNIGLLLTGESIFIDPGCVSYPDDKISFEDFWENAERMASPQYQHLKMMGLDYGKPLEEMLAVECQKKIPQEDTNFTARVIKQKASSRTIP